MADYSLNGRYSHGKWTWVVRRHQRGAETVTVGIYTDVAQAQEVLVGLVEAEERGDGHGNHTAPSPP